MVIVKGQLTAGKGEGRLLGYPTANLKLEPSSLRPEEGVYACWVTRSGSPGPVAGILISGVYQEPGQTPRVEVYILDFSGDLYGVSLEVKVVAKLREVVRGVALTQLKQRIEQDIADTRKILGLPAI
ncbi:MAG: riboflavin kinase [Candidatus Kerfeldbacteria bacterium]|nr:riboflavin kinase [Candidatus Kerfeldbacteria bacterium]